MQSAFLIFSFLFFTQGVFSQVDPWAGTLSFVLNENGYALFFNGETAGGQPTGTFDTLAIDVNIPYPSACIEWWARYAKNAPETPPLNGPVPLQTMMFYGSDVNNYIWVSVANGTYGGSTVPPLAYFKFKVGGTAVVSPISFKSWDRHYTWTQFAVCLQPSSIGQSYVFGLGDAGTGGGGPTYFSTASTFADIAGTTSLTIGYLGSALQTELNNPTNYGGRIGEIRIWNRFLSPTTDLVLSRYTSFPDVYLNLIHRYKFLEPSGNVTYDSVGTANGVIYPVFSGTGPTRNYNYFNAGAQGDMVPYWNLARVIPWNGSVVFGIAANAFPQMINLTAESPQGIFCLLGVCTGSSFTNAGSPSNASFTADRRACGLETYISPISDIQGTLTNNMNITILTGALTGSAVSSAAPVPAAGGTLTLTGTNLGLNGALANGESIVISLPNQAPVTCTSGYVNGNQLSCLAPSGVGFKGNLTITLCGTTFMVPSMFSYQVPVINPIPIAVNFQTLTFLGSNFGPSRKFNGVSDSVQISNGTTIINCNVTSNNDTEITCVSPYSLINGYQYRVSITIGGQTSLMAFTFQKCNPPCQNQGICQDTGVCNCFNTGFTGIDCSVQLMCQPTCVNGICVQKTDGTFNTTCSCNIGYAPPNCANLITSPVPVADIVGPVVAGTVTLIAISAIIIIILIRRQEKREGSNFIPLEKKDFTKIIYGDQLNQVLDKKDGDLQQLERLLVEDEGLEVAFAISSITQITEADKIAKALVVVFQDNSKIIKLLESFITQEVKTTESAGTLFRANSMVSKMFKFYSRLIGLPYLYVTIGPELGKLIEEELGLEVDPEKMEEGRDLDEMRWALMSQSQKILKQILLSHEKCPSQFRSLFAHIGKQVRERFPENVNTTIGGFIFLRLFCPAVSSPEAYGIVEEPPSADARRLLILITKVLQNLSNDVEFGSKEPYMTKMNDFIQSNRPKLVTFYENLLKPPTKPAIPCEMPRNIKPLNLHILAQHIRENLDKIEDQKIKAKLQQALPSE